MDLAIMGAGYVGLVSACCFAEMGYRVHCVDTDTLKIEQLCRGVIPIYEPGLAELLESNLKAGRLTFHAELKSIPACDFYFIAVGTPPAEDGSADIRHVLVAAENIGKHLSRAAVIVNKSTVPVGTADKVRSSVQEQLTRRGMKVGFDVVSNPEFLKEGDAINDFMRPDRVVVGAHDARAVELMKNLYSPFMRNFDKILFMGVRDAELTKYAANAMLATKISFMNEIAAISERMGVDVENVRKGIGSDSRIGYSFIYPGCGYGGSCLPKDVRALIQLAQGCSVKPLVLAAVDDRNREQKGELFRKAVFRFGPDLKGRAFGIWGLAFKPGTDDTRDAPALLLLRELVEAGAVVKAYDPAAMEATKAQLTPPQLQQIHFAEHPYDAVQDVDALILVTEWKPFRNPDFAGMKKIMRTPVIIDGRNQYEPAQMVKEGFEYFGIGRGMPSFAR